MKKFLCHKCGCYLGEMEKGRVHKKAVLLCGTCLDLLYNNQLSQLFNIFGITHGPFKKQVPEE